MILVLKNNGTIEVKPSAVPENLNNVYIEYVYPKGMAHLRPVLTWGKETFEGDNIYINKQPTSFQMFVDLYNGTQHYKRYELKRQPQLYIGYNVEVLHPDIINHLESLEKENKELKERGDIIWLN